MKIKCILKAEGFDFSFYFNKPQNLLDGVYSVVTFVLEPNLGKISIKSPVFFIYFNDLEELVGYFEERILSLKSTPDSELYTFVTYGLKFQIKALSGEISEETPRVGYFGIQCAVNLGASDAAKTNTYIGGESIITLENAQNFISSLKSAIADFSSS